MNGEILHFVQNDMRRVQNDMRRVQNDKFTFQGNYDIDSKSGND
jgi:hypothetical protein